MILPSKTIRPVDSLFCISSYIVEAIGETESTIDDIFETINNSYPKSISIDIIILCLDYLYIIGKLECVNETVKIKL